MSSEIGGCPSTAQVGMPLSTAEDMLTEALHNFDNLDTIRIDSTSYLRYRYRPPVAPGLHCRPCKLYWEDLRRDFGALGHLFQVIGGSICRANISGKIHLDLDLQVTEPSYENGPHNSPVQAELFDLSSPFWKGRVSLRVRKVVLVPNMTGQWSADLDASCPELQELSLLACPGGIQGRIKFDNDGCHKNIWHRLQILNIKGVQFDNTAMADFLKAHHGSLTRLKIKYVFLQNGSWARILQTIRDLPALESLRLSSLGQNVAYTAASETDCDARSCLRCGKRSDVLLALGALLRGVHTYKHQFFQEDYYKIDFTSANIALASKTTEL